MNTPAAEKTIFVALLDEGTSVWRPVTATSLGGHTYRIEGVVPQGETWQFLPGQLVECEAKAFSGSESGLVAVREVSSHQTSGSKAMDRPTKTCDECGNAYFLDTSRMASLCPQCAHDLYGYPPCDHVFLDGCCIKCNWNGAKSKFI